MLQFCKPRFMHKGTTVAHQVTNEFAAVGVLPHCLYRLWKCPATFFIPTWLWQAKSLELFEFTSLPAAAARRVDSDTLGFTKSRNGGRHGDQRRT